LRLAEERWPRHRVDPDELLWHGPAAERAELIAGMRPIYRFAYNLVRFQARLLFGTRYFHIDRGCIPGPLLVASNHISYMDPPLAGGAVPRELSYVAKRELFRFKPFGALIHTFNAVPITRGIFDRACFDVLRERVRAGGAVLFFPEGTRKPVGRLGKAKFGVGLVAQETLAPVLPVFISGSTRPWACLLRRERLEIRLGRPLHIAPLVERGLQGRELLEQFGEGVMAEIERLQAESGARADGAGPAGGR
jgi:1-acyl-sn-glycerol-3-phosphate acyltransferase